MRDKEVGKQKRESGGGERARGREGKRKRGESAREGETEKGREIHVREKYLCMSGCPQLSVILLFSQAVLYLFSRWSSSYTNMASGFIPRVHVLAASSLGWFTSKMPTESESKREKCEREKYS